MVPVAAYAPAASGDTLIAPPPRDYVDYRVRRAVDRATGAINITAPLWGDDRRRLPIPCRRAAGMVATVARRC